MYEDYDQSSMTKIFRDSQRVPRVLIHEHDVVSAAGTAQLAAQEYLGRFRSLVGAKAEELASLSLPPESDPLDAGVEYQFLTETPQFDTTTVSYYQTYFGLPVWEAGLSVHMKQAPFRIISALATGHPDIQVAKPSPKALARLKKLNAATLAKLLGIAGERTGFKVKSLRVQRQRLMIYRYEESKRGLPSEQAIGEDGKRLVSGTLLPLPPVGRGIAEGRHYVVAAVYFRLDSRQFGSVNWLALVEAETLSILYLRALVDDVCGLVFQADPMTLAGAPPPSANNGALNPLRSSVPLQELDAPVTGTYAFSGSILRIKDIDKPIIAPPTEPGGTDFNYQARTDDFAAVNAYYHCDRFFRLVGALGFPRSSHFGRTTVPLSVDHRVRLLTPDVIESNAHVNGDANGLLNVEFALADKADTANPIGIACDWRVDVAV